jgi:hypothetical protein
MNTRRVNWTSTVLSIALLIILGLQGGGISEAATLAQAGTTPVFINEIHYDNSGTDTGEAVEVAGPAGTDLSGWSLVLYNGNGGATYNTISLTGVLPDQQNGFGTMFVGLPTNGLQNGAPDGLALVDNAGGVVQFLSYEGTFTAANGPAAGMTSTDIGVAESSSTAVGDSLQLTGTGTVYEDFTWSGPAANTFGAINTGQSFSSVPVIISEIRIDQPGSDNDEYFELAGPAGTALDGLTYLVIGDGVGGSGVIENVTDLSGQSIGASGFFVAAESTFSLGTPDLITSLNFENSDNVTHLLVKGFTGASGDDLDTNDDGILDVTPWAEKIDLIALVEEPNPPSFTEYHYGPPAIGPDGTYVPGQVYRCDDGWHIGAFSLGVDDTPGAENPCGAAGGFGACLDGQATPIHTIQGSGDFSPENGNTHVIEGVVVGDFQNTSTELRGFFLQEEDTDADSDPMTSEGIFVYDNGFGVDVMPGDIVRVQGQVNEFETSSGSGVFLTELVGITQVAVCGSGAAVTPTTVVLPVANLGDWESYEGMLVTLPQELTVTENYNLGRYGQVDLSANGRLFSPTNVALPGAPALAVQDENNRRRIILDDANTWQNRDPIVYPAPELTAANTLRAGDSVTGLTGVLDQRFSAYRIQPTAPVNFNATNPRPATPPNVGGSLKVASFNVLNYFNGDGMGGGFPTPRGADTPTEFVRQRDKIINAIVNLDADVIGLMEIENDGYGPESAIQDLVNGLNGATAPGTYAFIDPGVPQIGTDAIAVGLIYKTATVSPVGAAAILDSSVDPRFLDTKNRPVLTQTFMQNSNGEKFTVAVNHLKSKGSPCDDVGDPNQGDGQGNCNLTRTNAAMALTDWLATDPTGSGDPDFLIIGDLNSYAMEDPIMAIKNAGYSNLLEQYVGPEAYSFVFFGQAGVLDHALGNMDMSEQVTGAAIWHINADEPRVLDYNEEFKSTAQLTKLYSPDQYRASDHDPVIIGLNLDSTAHITIAKDAQPDTHRNFRFDGDFGKFKLDDITPQDGDPFSASMTFDVQPGTYVVSEKETHKWFLTDIACDLPGAGLVDLEEGSVAITVGPRDVVTCTFVNQRESAIKVRKYNDKNGNGQQDHEPGLKDWEITVFDGQGNEVDSEDTNGAGKVEFRHLRPGQYTVCEETREGWVNTQPGAIDPMYGMACYTENVAPGQTWDVQFGNMKLHQDSDDDHESDKSKSDGDKHHEHEDAVSASGGAGSVADAQGQAGGDTPAANRSIYLPFVNR